MSDEQAIRKTVLEILGGIAPEADLAALAPEANFRRELDLDSDRKSTRLNSSHEWISRMPSSA